MAGPAHPGELTRRYTLGTAADDAALRRLLRENPMHGAVTVAFEREPDFFRGAGIAGAEEQTIVAFQGDRIACMGRCIRRDCWVNGHAVRTGYLSELRLDRAHGGRAGLLREGFAFFRKLACDDAAELYFTAIAADNDRARRFLERGVRGLPAYRFLANLETVLIAVPRRIRARLRVEVATPERVPEFLALLNAHGRRHQLSTVWTAEMLRSLDRHGMPLERFLIATDGGVAVACGALWDQRGFRQTVIRGYSRLLNAARPFVNAMNVVLGRPRVPEVGEVLAQAFLSPLAFVEGAEAILPDFIAASFSHARRMGVEFLAIALPQEDAGLSVVHRRFSTRSWRSRLYSVDWPERRALPMRGTAFLPDVSLL